jgi:hypothetical protein
MPGASGCALRPTSNGQLAAVQRVMALGRACGSVVVVPSSRCDLRASRPRKARATLHFARERHAAEAESREPPRAAGCGVRLARARGRVPPRRRPRAATRDAALAAPLDAVELRRVQRTSNSSTAQMPGVLRAWIPRPRRVPPRACGVGRAQQQQMRPAAAGRRPSGAGEECSGCDAAADAAATASHVSSHPLSSSASRLRDGECGHLMSQRIRAGAAAGACRCRLPAGLRLKEEHGGPQPRRAAGVGAAHHHSRSRSAAAASPFMPRGAALAARARRLAARRQDMRRTRRSASRSHAGCCTPLLASGMGAMLPAPASVAATQPQRHAVGCAAGTRRAEAGSGTARVAWDGAHSHAREGVPPRACALRLRVRSPSRSRSRSAVGCALQLDSAEESAAGALGLFAFSLQRTQTQLRQAAPHVGRGMRSRAPEQLRRDEAALTSLRLREEGEIRAQRRAERERSVQGRCHLVRQASEGLGDSASRASAAAAIRSRRTTLCMPRARRETMRAALPVGLAAGRRSAAAPPAAGHLAPMRERGPSNLGPPVKPGSDPPRAACRTCNALHCGSGDDARPDVPETSAVGAAPRYQAEPNCSLDVFMPQVRGSMVARRVLVSDGDCKQMRQK